METIGFVGFGEVASCFGAALDGAGARVLAHDVLLGEPGGRERLAARASGWSPGFVDAHTLATQSDIVLSTVTADVALAVARAFASRLRRGQAYVDLNATAPGVKREIAAALEPCGAEFVEGAILPAVGVMGARSPVLLCGREAGRVAATFTHLGLDFTAYGEDIGKASSFKMLRSVFSKGLEALLVESLLAARRAGVEQDLWREIVQTIDAASFEQVGGNWIRTHGSAHARRYHEMVQVAGVLEELGVEAPMTAATVSVFERSRRLALGQEFPKAPSQAADVIAALDRLMQAIPRPG